MSTPSNTGGRLYFLWDYDIGKEGIRHILNSGTTAEKTWIITRILEYAKWDDIWRYLTVTDIQEHLEYLRFRHPQDRELWAYALDKGGRAMTNRWLTPLQEDFLASFFAADLADQLLDQLRPPHNTEN